MLHRLSLRVRLLLTEMREVYYVGLFLGFIIVAMGVFSPPADNEPDVTVLVVGSLMLLGSTALFLLLPKSWMQEANIVRLFRAHRRRRNLAEEGT